MNLKQRILDYDNHLSESAYLDDLASEVAADELLTAAYELLQDNDRETLSMTLLFMQDCIQWYPGEERQVLLEKYPNSLTVKAIEDLLWFPNHFLRMQAGYTLGKTCSYRSVPRMLEAFDYWYERDPLMMRFFVGEIGWLKSDRFDEVVDRMQNSKSFMTRWVSVSFQDEFSLDDSAEQRQFKQQFWDQLRQDEHPLVRKEAEYEYRLQLFRLEGEVLIQDGKNPYRKKERKVLEAQFKPAIDFDVLKGRFENHLGQNGMNDYTIEDLATFISDYAEQHGISC